jgi:uncharacterized protein
MTDLFLMLVGLGIGMLSGLLGIGGGVVLVPVLTWLFGYDQKAAAGMTLAVLAVPVVLPGVWQYYLKGHIGANELLAAVWIALGFAAGCFLGGSLVRDVNIGTLRLLFGLMLIYVGLRFVLASEREVRLAALGLTAVALAWLSWFGLRLLGRRHLPRPQLGDTIRSLAASEPAEPDYYI